MFPAPPLEPLAALPPVELLGATRLPSLLGAAVAVCSEQQRSTLPKPYRR